jgi:lipopolysaccharide/colanic/teichoic acid biosynthesis glycosyltransferase
MGRPERTARVVRVANVVLAVVGVVLLWPVALVVALAVWAESGRPVLYRQRRVGRTPSPESGTLHVFTIYKFRSMRPDAERHTGPTWSGPSDGRVTRLGPWLRRSHLDELPQLWNVLRGDMNVVGPRPERPEFVRQLLRSVPGYGLRLRARPGITGLAQLRQASDRNLTDVARKVRLDLDYLRRRSVLFDLSLVLRTPIHVVGELWAGRSRALSRPTIRMHHVEARTGDHRGFGLS